MDKPRLAKGLTGYHGNGGRTDIWRTPGHSGRACLHEKQGQMTAGDLTKQTRLVVEDWEGRGGLWTLAVISKKTVLPSQMVLTNHNKEITMFFQDTPWLACANHIVFALSTLEFVIALAATIWTWNPSLRGAQNIINAVWLPDCLKSSSSCPSFQSGCPSFHCGAAKKLQEQNGNKCGVL